MSTDLNYVCTREGQVVGPFTREQIVQMKQSGEMMKFFWVWEAGNPQWAPANPPPPPPSQSPIAVAPMEAKTEELHTDEKTMGGTSTLVMPSQPARQYARFDSRSEFSHTHTRTGASTEVTSEYVAPAAFGFEDEDEEDHDVQEIPQRPSRRGKKVHAEESTQEVRRLTIVAHNHRDVINGSLRQPTAVGAVLVGPAPRSRMNGPFVKGSRIHLNVLDIESGKSENVEAQVVSTMRRGSNWEYRLKWDKLPQLLSA